jgi:hypothetical protein
MPCLLIFTTVVCTCRNIGQVHVALDGIMIPAKHGRDSLGEFGMVGFINTACVCPEILNLILPRLVPTELKLGVTSLALAILIY